MVINKTVNCSNTVGHVLSRVSVASAFAALIVFSLPSSGVGQCLHQSESKKLPQGLKLVIAASTSSPQISRPVTVHVELRNQSSAPVTIRDSLWPERDYELHLFDARGNQAPLTDQAKKMRFGPIHGSTTKVVLPPGEKVAFDEDPGAMYSVSEPGEYTLEVCRDIEGIGNIYSRKLVLRFTR